MKHKRTLAEASGVFIFIIGLLNCALDTIP